MLSRIGCGDGDPGGTGIGGRLPVPVEGRGVNLFAGAGGEVSFHDRRNCGRGRGGRVRSPPASLRACERASGTGCVAFEEEGCAVAHLRDGREDAPVPDGGGDQIFAGVEQGSEVAALVAPVGQIAASRAVAHALAVDVEHKTIVGTDAHGVVGGRGSEVKRTTEVEHQRFAQRGGGVRDPLGAPFAMLLVGCGQGLGILGMVSGCGNKEQQGDSGNF